MHLKYWRHGGGTRMEYEQPIDADRIVRDPEILAGKPVVKGTRIPVAVVIDYLAQNPDFDELFADYPRLTMDDVKACLAHAGELFEWVAERQPTLGTPAA